MTTSPPTFSRPAPRHRSCPVRRTLNSPQRRWRRNIPHRPQGCDAPLGRCLLATPFDDDRARFIAPVATGVANIRRFASIPSACVTFGGPHCEPDVNKRTLTNAESTALTHPNPTKLDYLSHSAPDQAFWLLVETALAGLADGTLTPRTFVIGPAKRPAVTATPTSARKCRDQALLIGGSGSIGAQRKSPPRLKT